MDGYQKNTITEIKCREEIKTMFKIIFLCNLSEPQLIHNGFQKEMKHLFLHFYKIRPSAPYYLIRNPFVYSSVCTLKFVTVYIGQFSWLLFPKQFSFFIGLFQ